MLRSPSLRNPLKCEKQQDNRARYSLKVMILGLVYVFDLLIHHLMTRLYKIRGLPASTPG